MLRLVTIGIIISIVVASKLTISRGLKKWISTAFIASSTFGQPLISHAVEQSLSDQLRNLQSTQILNTKARIENEESQALSRALQYPSGFLIGRGIVTLTQEDRLDRNPYGVPQSYLIDEALGKDEATLFVLAVGREGPPLAAKKYKNLNAIQFPILVEITTDDLLFPYTADAWLQSSNRMDSIAMTAILSADGKLSTASPSDRLGFGQSEPTNIAGVTTRTTAALLCNKKIDLSLYSKDEIALLGTIDDELDRPTTPSTTPTKK